MRALHYEISVNIEEKTMRLRFRAALPEKMQGYRIRVQAVFRRRQAERRYPMEVQIEENEFSAEALAGADIELPYVFAHPPRHGVTLTFALWYGAHEVILDDQPFPVRKEMFAGAETGARKNIFKFVLYTATLPALLLKGSRMNGGDKEKAKKYANGFVQKKSGYSYSPRQRNTDYFAAKYEAYAAKSREPFPGQILFLSERLPEEGGNLMLLKEAMEREEGVSVREFISTKTVDKLSKKELRDCARLCAESSVIILEDFYPQLHSLQIRQGTKVVQLWHACGAFKTFGFSRLNKRGGAPQSSMNHRNYDFVSVSGEILRDIYAESFAISPDKIHALGVPRTDRLFDEERKRRVREELLGRYPLLRGKKVVLFAPTFRGDGNKDAYYPRAAFDVNRFMEALPEDVFCIVKHHPFVHQRVLTDNRFLDRVMDMTGKEHINDLMLVSDLLITDYSSSVFEAAILGLPMLFYAFDKEAYMRDRDFYFDYDSFVPGPVAEDMDGLIRGADFLLHEASGQEGLPGGEINLWEEKRREFCGTFLGALDGHSTERVRDYILTHYLARAKVDGAEPGRRRRRKK